jgi:hypothetical protein
MVAINGIIEILPAGIKSTLYVDDFTIYTSGQTTQTIERRLQLAINKIQEWSNKTGFKCEKAACLHICKRRLCPRMACNLTIHNRPIECVEQKKFLGIIVDNKLNWHAHINYLRQTCKKTLDLLAHLSHKKWGADRETLLKQYTMIIKPKID